MNTRIILAGLVLLALPACCLFDSCRRGSFSYRKPAETVVHEETVVAPMMETMPAAPMTDEPVLVEDVEGFELTEPTNVLMPPTEESEQRINREEPVAAEDAWMDNRVDQAQEHGFRPVYFNFDDYSIRPDQKSVLDYNLKKVAQLTDKGSTVVVEGHSCRFLGSAVYNMMLSEKRAEEIVRHFVDQGIARDKLKVVGRGYEMCMVPEGDMEQQAPNRRVEFYVLKVQPPARAVQVVKPREEVDIKPEAVEAVPPMADVPQPEVEEDLELVEEN